MDPAELAMAESFVDEALSIYVGRLPPGVLAELREYLIDELTITTYGKRTLRRLGALPQVARSEEVERFEVVQEALKREGTGRK